MATYYTILTTIGQAKIANAVALSQMVDWTEMAVGDGNGNPTTPSESQTALVNEVYRAGINQLTVDEENPNYIVAEMVIPTNVGGWAVNEVGIFDDDGDLVAVANFPATYKPVLAEGSGRDLVVRIIIQVSNASVVQLKVDPAIVLASQKWVIDNFVKKAKVAGGTTGQVLAKKSNANEDFEWADPASLIADASETERGLIRLATTAQARALTDDTRAITPLKLLESGAVFPGEIRAFAGPIGNIPAGWLPCDGSRVSRTTYARLFAVIGTTYGVGNGTTTFTLPDLRGEFIRGLDNGRGVDEGRTLGSLQLDQMQRLTGAILAATTGGNAPLLSGGNGAFRADTSTGAPGIGTVGSGATRYVSVLFDSADSPGARVSSTTSGETRPRNVALNFIIKY